MTEVTTVTAVWLVVAACWSGAAVALVVGGRRRLAGEGRPRRGLRPWFAAAAVLAGVAAVASPRWVVLGAIGLGVALAGSRMVTRRRADRAAATVRARVIEACSTVEAELVSGQTPAAGLERAAAEWPALAPAARTAHTGGDVPEALRVLATEPGAGDLRVVAAAWQVSQRTGHGLGDAVARVAAELRSAEQTRRIVTGELASARATARLVSVLPVLALLMGSGAGGDPWGFLVGHPVGLACLAGGLGFGVAGLAWIEAIARDVERGR